MTVAQNPGTDGSQLRWTQIIYGLHAVSLLVGLLGAATVIGAFLFGWPSIVAVILNYVKRGDVRGTWLESHFNWQIRTFWWVLLWAVLIVVVSLPLTLVIIGFATWYLGLAVRGVWAVYRIARGWLRLQGRQPMPA